jgi:chromosome partitioning protein
MRGEGLGTAIATMNTKGGVGKSTVTLAIAETLAHDHHKKVLVIDADAQMSISVMLMPIERLNRLRGDGDTLVGLLHQTLILGLHIDWKDDVCDEVSDLDDVGTLHLLPGDLRLSLIERAVSERDRQRQLRGLVRQLLADARRYYDIILVDCPPGLSLLTEIWLRECDWQLVPVKPDFLSVAGLEMFREFSNITPDRQLARNIGTVVNMKHQLDAEDEAYHRALVGDAACRCFPEAIPYSLPIQHAARFSAERRSYVAKYPGAVGAAYRAVTRELLRRIGQE